MSRKSAADREKEELTASILEYFASIPDRAWNDPPLFADDILALSLCAVICGADSFLCHRDFRSRQGDLAADVPRTAAWDSNSDTIGRVLAALDPLALAKPSASGWPPWHD